MPKVTRMFAIGVTLIASKLHILCITYIHVTTNTVVDEKYALMKMAVTRLKISDFQSETTVRKLRTSSMQNSRKLSACEFPGTVKSRRFSLAKLK